MKTTSKVLIPFAIFTSFHATADVSNSDQLHHLSHLFEETAIVVEPTLVDCKLSGGATTTCFAITVSGLPVDHATGPWCPPNINATKHEGGIWLEDNRVYDVDGSFIKDLGTLYNDSAWKLYDEATGKIRVTDTRQSCEAAARPNVDPAYQNYCVECQLEYMDRSTHRTYVLPLQPVESEKVERVTGMTGTGVALNGVRLDGPAPTEAILGAHTLAPFDDCGGHINLNVGYHYHAATGCSARVASTEGHAPIIGIAMDGYKLHARLNLDGQEPEDLDQCRGHELANLGYHYHADEPGKNAILSCFKAQTGCSNSGNDTSCDATKQPGPRGAGPRREG